MGPFSMRYAHWLEKIGKLDYSYAQYTVGPERLTHFFREPFTKCMTFSTATAKNKTWHVRRRLAVEVVVVIVRIDWPLYHYGANIINV